MRKGNYKHGLRWHKSYTSWNAMMNRCHNLNDDNYHRYGARGIKVCRKWRKIEGFISDMGVRPKNTSLGRINNSKGYYPSNCRWEDRWQQNRNTSRNVYLKYKGDKLTLAEWARKLNKNRNTIKKRWRMGWAAKRIIETS